MQSLPVDSLIATLVERLRSERVAILAAPPGSGKTTRVAPGLVAAGLGDAQHRIMLLQPRRVAARATAQRIAAEQGWQLGHQVGYQVRFENRTTESTGLVVATEGVLLRQLAQDPTLSQVGTVILDEFHERSLNADLLLGMLQQLRHLREDLCLLVMSATLEAESVQTYLNTDVLRASGQQHEVDIQYWPPKLRHQTAEHLLDSVRKCVRNSTGDILVFLPGRAEISRLERALRGLPDVSACEILQLHGSLPLDQQTRVLQAQSRRRIILSTNVAETSLTIEGIDTVIDSGQVRVLRFNPALGLNRLQLEAVCQSSATQRAGRAGRLSSGRCIRLWDQRSQSTRPAHLEPEVLRIDLASALLQLHVWGETSAEFPWLTKPGSHSIEAAERLLEQLGAVSERRITGLGRRMSNLPVEPRLSRMLLAAQALGDPEPAALAVALLSERDPFHTPGSNRQRPPPTHARQRWDCDISQRVLALEEFYHDGRTRFPMGEIHRGGAQTIRQVAKQLLAALSTQQAQSPAAPKLPLEELISRALLAGFPDRLAKRRKPGGDRGVMVGGRGVRLGRESGVRAAELFLCVDVDDQSPDANVRKASGIRTEWLDERGLDEREELFFNPTTKQVEARRRRYWFDLLLEETPTAITNYARCRELLVGEASQKIMAVLPKAGDPIHSWLLRLACLRQWSPELDLPGSNEDLLQSVLEDLSRNCRSFAELKSAPWLDWLRARLTASQLTALEQECPERIRVPSGSHLRIEYGEGQAPVLAVRIQEVFGWQATPRIAFGRVPLVLHLQAPNFRTQQITDDLASFWTNTYPVVRRDLRGRYPKHAWPEDPLSAQAECKGKRKQSG